MTLRQRLRSARPLIVLGACAAAAVTFQYLADTHVIFKDGRDYRKIAIATTDAAEGREAVEEVASDRSVDYINVRFWLCDIVVQGGNKETRMAAFDKIKSDREALIDVASRASDFDIVKLAVRELVRMNDIGSLRSIKFYNLDPKVRALVDEGLSEVDAWLQKHVIIVDGSGLFNQD